MDKKRVGMFGEEEAVRHLKRWGYKIIDRNWHSRVGEIDVVAEKGIEIVFVEVKTRTSDKFGSPEESITKAKQDKIIRASVQYLHQNAISDRDWRVDLIAITCTTTLDLIDIQHYENVIVGPIEDFL